MTATPIHDELVDALRRHDVPSAPVPGPASTVEVLAPGAARPLLDDTARAVVALAREEAVAGGRARWGTGHVLLGLLRGGEAVAGLLHAAGASAGATRRSVQRYEDVAAGGADDTVGASAAPCSPAAAAVLDAAETAAWAGRRSTVCSADLLAALVDAPVGAAAGVLAALDVPGSELAEAARALAAGPAPAPTGRPWRDPSRLVRRRA